MDVICVFHFFQHCYWMQLVFNLTITRGKSWNPRGGRGRHYVKRASEKLKWQTVFEGFVFVSFRTALRGSDSPKERERVHSIVSYFNGYVRTSHGRSNEAIFSHMVVIEPWWRKGGGGRLEEMKDWRSGNWINAWFREGQEREVERDYLDLPTSLPFNVRLMPSLYCHSQ